MADTQSTSSSTSSSSEDENEEFGGADDNEEDAYEDLAKPVRHFVFHRHSGAAAAVLGKEKEEEKEEEECKLELLQSLHSVEGTGGTVWPAAWVIARWLCTPKAAEFAARANTNTNATGSNPSRPLRVLEIGCGVGFVGIVAAAALGAEVVLTDGDADAVEMAKRNVSRNAHAFLATGAAASATPPPGACVLKWGGDDAAVAACLELPPLNGSAPDVILCSDIMYDADGAPLLARTLSQIVERNPMVRILLAYLMRRREIEDQFFAAFLAAGLSPPLVLHEEEFVPPSKRNRIPRKITIVEFGKVPEA